ncbi:MAG TPA: hypothetical protein VFA18_18375, partial [Gemmataceae bacterium]|nr:hypothetical protein [Gemmataceae bacterium]
MRKTLVIALRDYLAAVRTRAFLISMVFLPLMMGGSIGMSTYIEHLEATKEKVYAIVDHTPGQHIALDLQQASRDYYHRMVVLQDMQS